MKIFAYILLLCSMAMSAHATQPIKIVSSFPAGSGPDTLSRKVASQMSAQLQVPVIVENRPGGNGAVAMAYAVNEKDPENVILYASNDNLVVYPMLSKDYRLIDNFSPLKEALWSELVLASAPNVKNFKELFQVNRISYGSWGVGSAPHLMGSELTSTQGYHDSVHVPYKDYGAWFSDISNGVLSFSFVTVASTANLEKAGKIKYHAIASSNRNNKYPGLPTLKELTNQPLTLVGWAGFYTNRLISSGRAQEFKEALDRAYLSQEVLETVNALNYNTRNLSINEFKNRVSRDHERYQEIIQRYNIKIN